MENYDFSGWATRVDLRCSDGRTIRRDAFKGNDGMVVPLSWNHRHDDPAYVLGHALLQNRDEGVYCYCKFNDTESGKTAKTLVDSKDITQLSIYANQLRQNGGDVVHGNIREVSLVYAGANPGAFIDSVIMHGEEHEDEAYIYTGLDFELFHSEELSLQEEPAEEKKPEEVEEEPKMAEDIQHADGEKTIADVFNEFTEEQKDVVYAMIGMAIEENKKKSEGDEDMKHHVFEQDQNTDNFLSHADEGNILASAKRYGSLKEAAESFCDEHNALMHADGDDPAPAPYGIEDINYLFPEARTLNSTPDLISRDMDWVAKVMNGTKHLPFSRVKTVHADITKDEARAKGYVKGNRKVEEVFGLLKRTTTPQTIYKKQKLDRDDINDITDFDVVAWLKREMRMMLDEEIARAALIGDGRAGGSDDKINESNIRPIWTDDELYAVRKTVNVAGDATDEDKAKAFIKAVIKARKDYKGSGNPTLFTTEDVITDCLLIEDSMGRVIYDTVEKLRTALRVKEIVTVPVMESQVRYGTGLDTSVYHLTGIIVNLQDYAFGADKGGAVAMFDDFDIDFNQMKYLIETRCSGALIKPHSALVMETVVSGETPPEDDAD